MTESGGRLRFWGRKSRKGREGETEPGRAAEPPPPAGDAVTGGTGSPPEPDPQPGHPAGPEEPGKTAAPAKPDGKAAAKPDGKSPAEPDRAPAQPPTRSTLPSASPLAPRRNGMLTGGIDLGGTKIAAAVIGPGHEIVSYRRRPTPDRGGPADVVRAMAVTIQEAAEDAGTEAHRLRAVGVGSPGSVDPASGAVSGAGNLPGWEGRFQLAMALREAIGTPVRVGNDVQVGTRAEYELGAGAGFGSLLGVFWGTGVGGGLILDGKPWLGRGRAGEIGHTLVRRKGARGLNGPSGTVEAYAGRRAMEDKARRERKKGRKTKLFRIMKEHEKDHLTSAVWHKALEREDELAIDLLNRAVRALSAGIGSAVNLLDVEAVVIGGGLGVRFADTLVPKIFDGVTPYLINPDDPPAMRVAALGDQGGVLGASLLVS